MSFLVKKTYEYFITLPDRFYPFANEIEGQWVRGRRSYERAATRAYRKYGAGRLGYKLDLYRELFHFLGSIMFITLATFISHRFFGGDTALYVLFGAAIFALSYQEFYLHPRRYKQRFGKGLTDWLTWVTPMLAYIFLFISKS